MAGLLDLLAQTWPARMGRGLLSAAALPGDVYQGKTQVGSADYYNRAADLASLMVGMPGGVGGLGSGARLAGELRPYQSAPDALMGFRKNGPQKAFSESNYKYELPVNVDLGGGAGSFTDSIKGLNKPHALERAYRNWPDAVSITPIE